MERTIICLVRHGETDWNGEGRIQGHEDIQMNGRGVDQAKAVADILAGFNWDAVITSPLGRAWQTAEIIADATGVDTIKSCEGLKERNFGAASGIIAEEVKKIYPEKIPGLEEIDHLRQRGFDTIEKIASGYSGNRIVAVSHGGLINSILYTLSEGEFGSSKTRLYNAGVNLLVKEDGKWHILFYNVPAGESLAELMQVHCK